MRKWLFIACLFSLLLINTRCSDFLEESSQDEVRPSTVEDLEQLMLGESYLRTEPLLMYLEVLTDNVQSAWTESHGTIVEQYAPAFTWQFDMFERMNEMGAAGGTDTWETLYSKIKGCNVTLDMLDKVDGSEANKLNQKGQALALRGFYYFILVNTFAEPYNKEGIDLDKAMGVPLILESAVKDEFPPRASIKAVYTQIEKDLLEAAKLMDEYGQDNIRYKVTPLFVYTLLSRMYLYMEDWDIRGFSSDSLRGNQKLAVSLAATCFLPFIKRGFRAAVSTYVDAGLLAPAGEKLFRQPAYWGIGIALNLRNDNLIIKNVCFRFTFYPTLPVDGSSVQATMTDGMGREFYDYRVSQPQVIQYE